MWKIGPEWAAQQAKFANARLQNTGVLSAWDKFMAVPSAAVAERSGAANPLGSGDVAGLQ